MDNELILELLENPSFIEWVHSDFEKNNDAWSSYIDQYPSRHEAINEAIRSALLLKGESYTFSNKEILFEKIESTLDARTEAKVVRLWPIRKIMTYAASVCILMVSIFYFGSQKSFTTDIGEQLVISLPDNSEVTLNARSKLTFNTLLWRWQRKINLQGEAFFDVEKGKKFTVQTEAGAVSVLGTSFNVWQKTDNLNVFCYTGKVSVQATNTEENTILTPGKGILIQHGVKNTYQSKDVLPDWKEGRETFSNTSLEVIAAELEKYFPYNINLAPDLAGQIITADIPVSDLDSALQHITWPFGLQYKISGSEVTISR